MERSVSFWSAPKLATRQFFVQHAGQDMTDAICARYGNPWLYTACLGHDGPSDDAEAVGWGLPPEGLREAMPNEPFLRELASAVCFDRPMLLAQGEKVGELVSAYVEVGRTGGRKVFAVGFIG
ncbi:MAG: hypothetical protein ABIG68_05680, partial [Acidobacteriota bacterium]